MPAYVIVETDVSDPERYEHYKTAASAAVTAHGGRYLVRGGEQDVLEGDWRAATRMPSTTSRNRGTSSGLVRSSPPAASLHCWRYLGRSRTGLRSKKPTGRRVKPQVATGITGQSSARGKWVIPKVCQRTMSWPSRSRSAAT